MKTPALCAAAAVLFALFAGRSDATAPVRIMPLGDSITEGSYNDMPNDGSYRNDLHNRLVADGFNVDYIGTFQDSSNPGLADTDHQAVPGIQIEAVRANLPLWLKSVDDPDVILVHLGTNDFAAGAAPTDVIARMRKLIEELATGRPYAKILVANLILRTDVPSLQTKQAEFASMLPALINEQQAHDRNVELVDMQAALLSTDLLDGLHPNSIGYSKMASVWHSAITAVITPAGTEDPPAILRVEARNSLNSVSVSFSKPVDDSAAHPSNFSIDGGITVKTASLDPVGKRRITLGTSALSPGMVYTLTVDGVRDLTPAQLTTEPGANRDFAAVPVIEGSFESGGTAWSITGNTNVITNAGYSFAAATSGNRMVVFNASNNTPNGTLSQLLNTEQGRRYRLNLDVGATGSVAGTQKLQITVNGESSLLSHTEMVGLTTGSRPQWRSISLDFVADAGPVTLLLQDVSDMTASIDLLLDDLRIDVVNPLDAGGSSLVINGSFEFGNILSDNQGTALNGWSISGNITGLLSNAPSYLASDGNRIAVFNQGNHAHTGAISATLPLATTPGSIYLLAYDLGITGTQGNRQRMGVSVLGNTLDRSWQEDIDATGTITRWQTKTYTFVADSTETLLTFTDLSGELDPAMTNASDLLLDDIRATESPVSTLEIDSNIPSGVVVQVYPPDVAESDAGATSFMRTYAKGSIITLKAPDYTENQVFTKWQRNGQDFTQQTTATIDFTHDEEIVAVYSENQEPAAADDSYVAESGSILIVDAAGGVLANDSDPEGSPLLAVSATTASNGKLTLNPDGGFSYEPHAGYVGQDTFTYFANDGLADSPSAATVTLTVIPRTGGLIANGSFEAGAPTFNGSLNDWNILNGDPFGQATFSGPATYTPIEGNRLAVFNGGDNVYDDAISQTFPTVIGQAYLINLDLGITGIAGKQQKMGISIASGSNNPSWQETITAAGSSVSFWQARTYVFIANAEQTTITFTDLSASTGNAINADLLLDNVRVNPGTSRTLTVESAPLTGLTISLNPPDANNDGDGLTNFTRSYFDGETVTLSAPPSVGGSIFDKWLLNGTDFDDEATTLVTIAGNQTLTAVYATNSPPLAVNDTYLAEAGLALSASSGDGVLQNDSDPNGSPLTATLVTGPAEGMVTLHPDGGFTYTPDPNHSGSDSFTYRANDGLLESNTATVSITVLARTGGLLANGSFEIGLPANFGSLDGWTLINDINDPSFGYTTNSNAFATYNPTNGDRMLLFNGGSNNFSTSISQTFETQVGQTYELQFDQGITGETGRVQKLEISLNGVVGSPWQETITSAGPAVSFWETRNIVFQASDTTTTLTFRDASADTGYAKNADMMIDHVRINPVVTGNNAPDFASDPIVANDATQDAPYAGTLAGSATDPDSGDTLTFTKESGPDWLTVATDGTLGGTPSNSDVGLNEFTIRVTDGGTLFVEATLQINVLSLAKDDFVSWLEESEITGGPGDDFDSDGISNLIEYIIGGNPASGVDSALLPAAALETADPDQDTTSSEYLVFTHRRTARATTHPDLEIRIEWNTGLGGGWADAATTDGVVTLIEPLGTSAELVKVYLPRSLNAGGRLFARMVGVLASGE